MPPIDVLPVLMFAAIGLLLFSGFPVAFVLGGVGLGFGLLGILAGEFTFIQFFTLAPRIWGGIAENLLLTAVPMFIFMGTLLERAGIAAELLECLEILLRRLPGGLALSVIVMGTIMAATTGIIGASVVMLTLLALPVMLKRRYAPPLATGTIAASGTLGILIPPSIMLVVMADLMARSVGNLFFAALLPGLVLATLYAVYILAVSAARPELAPRPAGDGAEVFTAAFALRLAGGLLAPTALIFLVLGSILLGWASPTEAAGVGAFGAIALAALFKPAMAAGRAAAGRRVARFTAEARRFPALLAEATERSALTGAMVFAIFIGASAFSYVFRMLGGDDVVIRLVEDAGFGPWGVLLVLMAVIFILGFFFDWIEITLITLPVFVPIIELLDFGGHVAKADLLYWFAILMAVNLQTSFLTPPLGFALFYVKGAAPPGVGIEEIYRGIVPFVALQLIALALVMAFPGLALWLPNTYLK